MRKQERERERKSPRIHQNGPSAETAKRPRKLETLHGNINIITRFQQELHPPLSGSVQMEPEPAEDWTAASPEPEPCRLLRVLLFIAFAF